MYQKFVVTIFYEHKNIIAIVLVNGSYNSMNVVGQVHPKPHLSIFILESLSIAGLLFIFNAGHICIGCDYDFI